LATDYTGAPYAIVAENEPAAPAPAPTSPVSISPSAAAPSPVATTQAPAAVAISNPQIASSPPASQLSNNQSAQLLHAAGLPAQSLQAFIGAGLEPRRLLELLQSGWDADKTVSMAGQFAQPDGGHAEGGRATWPPDNRPQWQRWKHMQESQNVDDRRNEDFEELPQPYPWRRYWNPRGSFEVEAQEGSLAAQRLSVRLKSARRRDRARVRTGFAYLQFGGEVREPIGTSEFPRRQHNSILGREVKAFLRRCPEGQKIELEQRFSPIPDGGMFGRHDDAPRLLGFDQGRQFQIEVH
jgi:hypothetical protein